MKAIVSSVCVWLFGEPTALALDPHTGDGEIHGLVDRAAGAVEACETLSFRARYHWSTTGVLGGGDGTLEVDCRMARGGRFRVGVRRDGEEIAGVCSDGSELTEWSADKKQWTRYPPADRIHGLRLIETVAPEPEVAQALARFASSWLDPPSCFTETFKDAMQKAERVTTRKAVVGGRPCDIITFRATRKQGVLNANQEASVAFREHSALPVFEETIARVKGLIVPLGEQTRRVEYQGVTVNAPIEADAFIFSPPADWEFIAPEQFKTAAERLLGQSVVDWEFQSIDGQRVSIGELSSDKPVLLVAWATWCSPCKLELAELRECYRSADFRRRLHIVAVSADRAAEMVRMFIKYSPLPFTVVHDPQFLAGHGLSGLPTTLLIDRRGRVVRTWGGWPEGAERRRELVAALDELEEETLTRP